MIVNEDVRHALAHFDGIDLNPCDWEAIYDLPIDECSVMHSVANTDVFSDDAVLRLRGHLRPADARIARHAYFEVLAPYLGDLNRSADCSSVLRVPRPDSSETDEIRTSLQLHEIYPVMEAGVAYITAERVYSLIEPHVNDPDVFSVHEYTVR